jgi:hypothetical protein
MAGSAQYGPVQSYNRRSSVKRNGVELAPKSQSVRADLPELRQNSQRPNAIRPMPLAGIFNPAREGFDFTAV